MKGELNMANSKIIFGGEVLIDLTADTVTEDKVLSGVTFHDKKGDTLEGTCSYDSDTSGDTAAVAEILAGKTAHARGRGLTGTMPNNGAVSGTIDTKTGEYTIAQGYHDGSGKVAISPQEQAKIIGTNIREGITILGVTTMPGDDVTHPVPDNTGYITEGQYYLKGGHIEPFGSLSRLKQNVNGKTRDDHRALMDGMIRLYAQYKESLEKRSMGFMMTEWDDKLLKYGELFESKMMDLSVNIPLEDALDLGWTILAECFAPNETGLKTSLIKERWPDKDALN